MAEIDFTNEQVLAEWDLNKSVWTCKMGGLGPGYEQVIHMMAFEILRSMMQIPHPVKDETVEHADEEYRKAWEAYHSAIEATPNVKSVVDQLFPTGAQWGAAFNIASVFIINGYAEGIKKVPKDRLILVQRDFPNVQQTVVQRKAATSD